MPNMRVNIPRILGFQLRLNSIKNRLYFGFIAFKQTIPKRKNARKIFIEILYLIAVMNAVVRGRYKNPADEV
jgi:hypothetical protein